MVASRPPSNPVLTAPAVRQCGPRWGLPPIVRAARPQQFTKNGIVFLAFIFTVGLAWQPAHPHTWLPLLGRSLLAFVAFCAVSAGQYLVNDAADAGGDRLHPHKRLRPVAAGQLRPSTARITAAALIPAGLLVALPLGARFELAISAYAGMLLAYTFALKHLVLLDVAAIAAGFVLRAAAGALAIRVPISPWLYVCTSLGALLLAINKRRHELLSLEDAAGHRPILARYTPRLLDRLSGVVAAATIVAYTLYTATAAQLPRNHVMLATVPFVACGVGRYLYLVHGRLEGGSPDELIIRDRPLLACLLLWLATAGALLATFR